MSFQLDEQKAASLKLFVVLSKAYKTVMDHAVKDMKQHGLSPSEFTILEVLYNKGRIPLQQIGSKILVTSGSVTYNIDKLENRGLLRRVPCTDDRRVIFAEITEEGSELFDRIFPEHADVIHTITSGLTDEEKQAATELLKKLGKGIAVG
ncbi:MarR family 2-MHQ and catechol resistance regulon transcriptional repressor [Paenibacillus phyllosphaerae]|uniref:MarR family 2-MHQ and catechol resistance regulon transcriptional repressor n=1 Tax=Paenibacillus phyllosphaerae TaxID=274593 RepID=A0A7W5FQM0_9BACL|nr:MarR family transcriptional regulator [Paenibacillus phyllosphaerae]MBB3113591.1 MarR family 2-MHQ and catechol resistance regulon transcriptional repressor [Paenibacillus phyllosphaerae]